jgi:Ca-activated chloride channel homolog
MGAIRRIAGFPRKRDTNAHGTGFDSGNRKPRGHRMIRRILLRLFALIALALAASATAQIPLDSLHGPVAGMIDPETKQQVAVSPAFTRVNVVITDGIAQAVVTQRFVNPFRGKTETVYLFPLPDQGAVHGMKYQYKDSVYVAAIMERQKAQSIYDSIKNAGGQAALLLQEKPNIFQQRIAALGPGDTAFVEIRLSIPLKYVDGELELAFPTRIGPRYGTGPGAGNGPWNPPEDRSGPEFQFNVVVESGLELGGIYSPTHPIEIGTLADTRKTLQERGVLAEAEAPKAAYVRSILLKTAATYPNRDYVLRLARSKAAPDFSLATAADAKSQGYFMLNLYPDTAAFAGKRGPMELVILLDISGSQYGWPLEREKEIALNILSRLTPDDDIDVLAFSDAVTYAFGSETPVAADAANQAIAERFIRGLTSSGGTQLLNAVNKTLAVPSKTEKQRYYVFLTDGFITDETAVLQAISQHASKPAIFTFGAGNSLNRYFLEECAKVGNGFATPMVEGDAVGPLVESAWGRLEAPQIDNLSVDFGGLAVAEVLYPVSNRLYRGLPYRVIGKYAEGGAHTVTVKGTRQGQPVSFSHTIDFSSEDALAWAVPKLWAREKIGQLLLQQGTGSAQQSAITALSIEYQVLCRYTAFLAANPQLLSADNSISKGMPTRLVAEERLNPRFDLSMRGGFLYLEWKLPARLEVIRVFDMQGRLVFEFRPGRLAEALGRWTWDGRDASGRPLGRGRYLISVQTRGGTRNSVFVWNPR